MRLTTKRNIMKGLTIIGAITIFLLLFILLSSAVNKYTLKAEVVEINNQMVEVKSEQGRTFVFNLYRVKGDDDIKVGDKVEIKIDTGGENSEFFFDDDEVVRVTKIK